MEITLSPQQAKEILSLANIEAEPTVSLLKKRNHVFRIETEDDVYYLKIYTKDWYSNPGDDAGAARHESAGFLALAKNGVPTAQVLVVRMDYDNPLRRPFLLTRQLRGRRLTDLLNESSGGQFNDLLRATGQSLRRYHQIVYRYPGYILDPEGPQSPPENSEWLHFYCSAARMQKECLKRLDEEGASLPADLAGKLKTLFSTLEQTLAPEYEPPRFIQGDCHAHQFYLFHDEGRWQVSGSVDMEVASAGAPICDLLKFCAEMAESYPIQTRWWEPLFAGCGEPNFERLRLLFVAEHISERAPRVLAAKSWEELFAAMRVN